MTTDGSSPKASRPWYLAPRTDDVGSPGVSPVADRQIRLREARAVNLPPASPSGFVFRRAYELRPRSMLPGHEAPTDILPLNSIGQAIVRQRIRSVIKHGISTIDPLCHRDGRDTPVPRFPVGIGNGDTGLSTAAQSPACASLSNQPFNSDSLVMASAARQKSLKIFLEIFLALDCLASSSFSPSPATSSAGCRLRRKTMQYAILAVCRRPGFVFCPGWYPETFRARRAVGFSESWRTCRIRSCLPVHSVVHSF